MGPKPCVFYLMSWKYGMATLPGELLRIFEPKSRKGAFGKSKIQMRRKGEKMMEDVYYNGQIAISSEFFSDDY